jgi:rod shape-determining protein MreD
MIMASASGQQLLLPVRPWFIWLSLLMALLLNVTIDTGLGRQAWMPDVLAIALVFWAVHQPLRVGIGVAFAFGVCMDVHQAALLGQHALGYTVVAFLAVMIHRRLLWYGVSSQALQVLPLFVAMHALEVLLRLVAGGGWPGWSALLAPVLAAGLWPLAQWLLLAPQRKPPEQDDHRPL